MDHEREEPGSNTHGPQPLPFEGVLWKPLRFPEHVHLSGKSPLEISEAEELLSLRELRSSLPVLRVSQGQAAGDVAHLEGDALPISVEGEGLR